jgi:hypothetical protein
VTGVADGAGPAPDVEEQAGAGSPAAAEPVAGDSTAADPAAVDSTAVDSPAGDSTAAVPAGCRAGLRTWLACGRRHVLFLVLIAAGAGLRLTAVLGFRPALWFNDGFEYVAVALRLHPDRDHPVGYAVLLRALLPLHSFTAVVVLQHLVGLAMAAGCYALLCRLRVQPWLAALGALPLLLNVFQVQLEHLIMSDTLFMALLIGGVLLLVWHRRPGWPVAGAAGALFAAATLTRSVGLPMLILSGLYLLLRRAGWRPVLAFALLGTLPLAGYATWFHASHGRYALTTSDGVFLYARVQSFAECTRINPPPRLRVLCDRRPTRVRGAPSDFIWHARNPGLAALLGRPAPNTVEDYFVDSVNDPAREFAVRAILAQPNSYLRAVLGDFWRSFGWQPSDYPNDQVVRAYRFSTGPLLQPTDTAINSVGGTAVSDTAAYEHGTATTQVVSPYAGALIRYQHIGRLPGPFLGGILLVGLAGLLAFRKRDERRWTVLLLWTSAVAALLIPPMTAAFDYRYLLPAIPLASTAACLAIAVLTRPARAAMSGAAGVAGGGPQSGSTSMASTRSG